MVCAEDDPLDLRHRLIADVWGGLAVMYREAAYTPVDIVMPRTGVGVAFKGDAASRSRLGKGTTNVRMLSPGSVFVFADDAFTWVENDTAYAGLALGFDESVLHEFADQVGAPRPDLRSCHFGDDETLLAISRLMASELVSSGIGADLYRDSLAVLAKVHLLRRYGGSEPLLPRSRAALSPSECARVHDYMIAHLAEGLTLERLGKVVNLSAFHFARLFKAATGKPPYRYLTGLRVQKACELLVQTRLPVSSIAWRVGFASHSQFAIQFRRCMGVPPAVFRQCEIAQESGGNQQDCIVSLPSELK